MASVKEIIEQCKGDPLGFATDPEASRTVVAAARQRWLREQTEEAKAEYEAVKKEHEKLHGE